MGGEIIERWGSWKEKDLEYAEEAIKTQTEMAIN